MPEGAKDQSGLDAGSFTGLGGHSFNNLNDPFRRETSIRMQKRGKADFGVEEMVLLELCEKVENDEAQPFCGLHEGNGSLRSRQGLGQIGTLHGRDKIVTICFFRHRGIDLPYDIIAQ